MEITIFDLCSKLKELAKNQDDIFLVSYRADGTSGAYRVYNKADGKEGEKLDGFNELKDIIFTDTADRERTTFSKYMEKFGFNKKNGDGEAVVGYDGRTRTTIMFVVHNTNLGPAIGGLRQKDYSNLDSMITDNLRLARGMTYKAASAKTATGGGKATRTVPKGVRKEANMSTARLLNYVNEQRIKRGVKVYVTAEDSNTVCSDFDDMSTINNNVICKSLHMGGAGNPSPVTAIGVYHACKAGAEFAFKDKSLKNKTVLISGIGQVGFELLKNLVNEGVEKVICAEMSKERIEWVKKQFKHMKRDDKVEFMVYSLEELKSQKFLHDLADKIDIFAPCAMGKSINDTNIDAIKGTRLKLICGGENNQLADEQKHGKMLQDMGIVYVPDYVANAGGLINSVMELEGRTFLIAETIKKTQEIENTVREVLELSQKEKIPTYLAANKISEQRFLK